MINHHYFYSRYRREFGFILQNKNIVVDDIRVRGVGKVLSNFEEDIEQAISPPVVDKVYIYIFFLNVVKVKQIFKNGFIFKYRFFFF